MPYAPRVKSPRVAAILATALVASAALVCIPEASASSLTARYVGANCTTGAVDALGSARPKGGVTVDGVTATFGADGIPTIALASTARSATTLGSVDLVKGKGRRVKVSDTLTLNYCGIGLKSKSVVDSSWSRGGPVTFPLKQLIYGWRKGIPGMQVGGTRLLVIPASLAYGSNPPPGGPIRPNETLAFVITLSAIG